VATKVGDVEDLGGFAPDFACGALGAASASASAGDDGVGGDQLLGHGVGKQKREALDDAVDGGLGQAGGAEFLLPGAMPRLVSSAKVVLPQRGRMWTSRKLR
jgi:hypothetical protein